MALLGSDTSVTGPLLKGVLLLETLAGTEQLGLPYVYQLGLLSEDPNLDPAGVLGKPLAVGIKLGSGEIRYFHGVVTGFEKSGMTRLHTRYAVRLNPFLTQLGLAHDCRIFNDAEQNAVGIVTSVLAERGMSDLESGSIKDHAYRARELCVQYQETDLGFVQRLLEEEGIYYFFRHEESKHTMVLADAITAHETVAGYESVRYTSEERRAAGVEEHFWGMQVRKGRLQVGAMDPISEIFGIQSRLANLGYYSGPINGQLDEATLGAISAFRSNVLGDDLTAIDSDFIEALDRTYCT